MSKAMWVLGAATIAAAGAVFSACGGDDSSFQPPGDAGLPETDNADTSNPFGGKCTSNTECDGGVCISGSGVCCASAANVCGGACCGGGSVCLFDQCVVPGKPCYSGNDCDPGQYCEPGLGPGAGDAGALEAGCTQAPPAQGRCLPLPPACDADAGTLPDGGTCVASCEYHPPGGGPLSAITKWTWGPTAKSFPAFTDVWSTPSIGRVHDSNCDGKVDELDAPVVVFVSGNAVANGAGTCCQCTGTTPSACHSGVLRMVDGATGQEIWSLDKASSGSAGFSGFSNAIGDIDGDLVMDIVAVTGEGYVVLVDGNGKVKRTSDKPIPGNASASFGWGGGLAIADTDGDGFPEIAFGSTVFSTKGGAITLQWTGAQGAGGGSVSEYLSTFVDLDGASDNHLELLAGNTAYKSDGTVLWSRAALPDGFSGVGDFDVDGKPEAVLIAQGQVWILDGATGATVLGPTALPGTGSGGPPTIADFDGDKKPEIGVAMATFYSVMKPNYGKTTIDVLWKTQNHDLSSSVTGSTVFDFEGDGKAEVVYGDECFLWVFDGTNGSVRFAAPHSSFTATEASLLADVDGDGHAEMLMVSNSADPSSKGWGCMDAMGNPVTLNGVTWAKGPAIGSSYRGLSLFGDSASSWVGTRTIWNEHTYHVSNVCDDRDHACAAPNHYGSIPTLETKNWTLPWLNDFRQNVQDKGIFNAPDAVVSLAVECSSPLVAHVSVRNIGESGLPAGVVADVYIQTSMVNVGQVVTTHPLLPGQTETLSVKLSAPAAQTDTFYAQIIVDPKSPKFHECRADNDTSDPASPQGCVN